MLNYNKIQSDINKKNIDLTEIARYGKLKYGSFRDRYIEKRLYANEIEVIAQFFDRSIDYYFDREEKQSKVIYNNADNMRVVEESQGPCLMCVEKEKRIADKVEIINGLKGQIELLGFQLGKNLKTGSE